MSTTTVRTVCLLTLLLAAAGAVQAQQVYRITGPDGRVTFSDRPAPTTADRPSAGAATAVTEAANGAAASTAGLPYELRTVAQRYPVTLYTSGSCNPCNSARSLLRGRGVPFSEKTVETAADAEALKRISGDASVPFATIGSQFLHGFSDAEWTQYLDAAGYPRQSQLPGNYLPSPPSPLVAAKRLDGSPAAAPAPTRRAPAPVAPPPSNPAGIQF